jgi:hypothetical protein
VFLSLPINLIAVPRDRNPPAFLLEGVQLPENLGIINNTQFTVKKKNYVALSQQANYAD